MHFRFRSLPALAFLSASVALAVGCESPGGRSGETSEASASPASTRTASSLPASAEVAAAGSAVIEVDGLTCPFCVYGIEKRLRAVDGVTDIRTEWKKGLVTVRAREDANIEKEQLARAVKDAGFTARSVRLAETLRGAMGERKAKTEPRTKEGRTNDKDTVSPESASVDEE